MRAAGERKALRDWDRVECGQDGDTKQPPLPSITPLETVFDFKMSQPPSHLCVLTQFYVGATYCSSGCDLFTLNINFKGGLEEPMST